MPWEVRSQETPVRGYIGTNYVVYAYTNGYIYIYMCNVILPKNAMELGLGLWRLCGVERYLKIYTCIYIYIYRDLSAYPPQTSMETDKLPLAD